ncbi:MULTISPECIES: DMT family transporter [unclassified Acidovorax]|uniref:DMT family transporter n=1 Tax=unclassified Acidovorax TaxID=2684926 RepID=UPI000C19CD4E|nr:MULTISPECIES: DMT family transporter [unclassified Acidovorax]PIF18740.1 EamA-like transporter family protein [Acidovorax sp. 59]PKW02233.1 EamA-like transporter family protein [Acidovorax sp. 30]
MAENAPSQSSASPAPPIQAVPSSNLRGIIAMVAAVGFFSLMDALLKTLSAHYPAMQVAALRGWAALPLVALYALWRGEVPRLLKVRWPLHFLRGGLNVAMLALFAFAIRELALAEAYTLFFIAPLLITALSTVVLREKVRAAHWVAIALGMVGVLVALRPNQEAFFTLGALAVLAAATCYAVSAITGRMLTRTDSSASLVFWTTTLLALGAGALAWPHWVGVAQAHWPLVAGLAITGFAGQLAITEAFRHGQASVVAPFEYTALAWGMGLDWVLWQTVPGYSTLLGGAIIIGSGLYLVRQERTQAVVPP